MQYVIVKQSTLEIEAAPERIAERLWQKVEEAMTRADGIRTSPSPLELIITHNSASPCGERVCALSS